MTEHHLYPEIPLLAAAAARRTDPPTSHAAAARAPVSEHCRRIIDALASGPAGQSGIAERTGLSVAAVSKRLPEIGERTLICEHGEQYAATFRPVTYGDGRGVLNRWEGDECETYSSVSHWMPLPEPPPPKET